MTISPSAGKQLCAGQIEVIKDNAALALMHLALAPELHAHHFNAAGYVRQAANLAGVTDCRLRAITGPDVWIALFPRVSARRQS